MKQAIILGAILLLLSVVTRLPLLDQPTEVVFDEVHFGKFVTAYCCTHERFFDIHPPHAKLLIAGAAYLGGYQEPFPFANIGEAYPPDLPVVALRLAPALAGLLLPLLLYILVQQLGGSVGLAFIAGWAVVLDNALTVQSRVISLDTILLASIFGSLIAWLVAERVSGRWQWLWWVLAGGLAGLAVGTKFTGLAALGLLGVLTVVRLLAIRSRQQWGRWIAGGLTVLGSAVVVYLVGWLIHFVLLSLPGDGDAFHVADFSGGLVLLTFFRELWELHEVMFAVNYNLGASHPYASFWWTWPVMGRPIFYWQGTNALIYFLGNPVVWWGSLGLGVAALLTWGGGALERWTGSRRAAHRGEPRSRRVRHAQQHATSVKMWIPVLGYGIAMLPLVRVPRALFLYHYLTPLLFGLVVGLLGLERSGWWRRLSGQRRWQVITGVVVIVAVFFLFFSPLTYGFPIGMGWQKALFWFPSWR